MQYLINHASKVLSGPPFASSQKRQWSQWLQFIHFNGPPWSHGTSVIGLLWTPTYEKLWLHCLMNGLFTTFKRSLHNALEVDACCSLDFGACILSFLYVSGSRWLGTNMTWGWGCFAASRPENSFIKALIQTNCPYGCLPYNTQLSWNVQWRTSSVALRITSLELISQSKYYRGGLHSVEG